MVSPSSEQLFRQRVQQMTPLIQRHIKDVVQDFGPIICSKYRSSMIDSFEELVGLLKKRDCIDPDDISSWAKLNNVCQKYVNQSFYSPPPPSSNQILHNGPCGPPINNSSGFIRPEVREYLCNRITYSWRNFARELNLNEGDISQIDGDCGSQNHRACLGKVLDTYEKNRLWSSEHGNANEDILAALDTLGPLSKKFVPEFKRLIKAING